MLASKDMSQSFSIFSVLIIASITLAAGLTVPRQSHDNDGIHLAIEPTCGALGGNVSNVNSGINLSAIKTIVAFGVSKIYRRLL
jgi:hypothetical protein